MADRHPYISTPDVEAIAQRVRGVDLSGGASTLSNGRLTVGKESLGKAYATALAPTSSPALLAAYREWRDRQDRFDAASTLDARKSLVLTPGERGKHAKKAARHLEQARKQAALAGPALDAYALAKARKTLRKAAAGGPEAAAQRAFAKYRQHGGASSLAAFRRKIGA